MSSLVNISSKLKTGDVVNAIGGLKDCKTNRCINIRIDGKADAPSGWKDPNTPPNISNEPSYYYTIDGGVSTYNSDTYTCINFLNIRALNKNKRFNTIDEAISKLISYIPSGNARRGDDGVVGDAKSLMRKETGPRGSSNIVLTNAVSYLDNPLKAGDPCSASGGVLGHMDNSGQKQKWPSTMCSEVVFDKGTASFKAASRYDDNLPERLKTPNKCVVLCDENGNKVSVRVTDKGIEITQEQYHQTALVDPSNYTVVGVWEGSIEIKLSSETDAILPKDRSRTTIGVGEGVTVTSNTAVEWEIDSKLVNIIEQKPTYIKFSAKDSAGSVTVKAKTACTDKSIKFTIIEPSGLKFNLVKKLHVKDCLSAGFIAHIYLLPREVNFYAVTLVELESFAVSNGLLSEGNNKPHAQYKDGRSEAFKTDGYDENFGTKMLLNDFVWGGQNEYPIPLPFETVSNLKFEIEYEWGLKKQFHKLPEKVIQTTSISKDGYTTTTKSDQSARFYYKDDTINSDQFTFRGYSIPVPKPHKKE